MSPSQSCRDEIKALIHHFLCLFHGGKALKSKALYGPGFTRHPMKGKTGNTCKCPAYSLTVPSSTNSSLQSATSVALL